MKKTSHKGYAETLQEAKEAELPTSVASLEIVKVVREFIPIKADVYGQTFGEMLDSHLRELAETGQELQTVSFHIEPDMWSTYAQALQPR